jgi:Restriction endonuclease
VDEQLRIRLQKMDWRQFEDTFLTQVLEKLGFQDVQITQRTRDGGVDARVAYKRGIVEAHAIVQAKRWNSKSTVGDDEVRALRGTKGDEDTAIIITTAKFSQPAKDEARPGQNQKAVYLIDGDRLIEICKQYEIGIKRQALPPLLLVDEEEFDQEKGGEAPGSDPPTSSVGGVRRLRDEMLGDRDRGLTAAEIATLLGLKESTVTVYLTDPSRRQELGDRLREDPALRVRALQIVGQRRGG